MRRTSLIERAGQIQARLDAGVRLPPEEDMMNSGRRRTADKRNLLAQIREASEAAGKPTAFKANA